MMKRTAILFILTVLLTCSACAVQQERSTPGTDGAASIPLTATAASASTGQAVSDAPAVISTYYGNPDPAPFKVLKSGMLARILSHWTNATLEGITNPRWNYDSFTRYQVLDHNLQSATRRESLYYCTFTADNGRHGYVVLQYEAGSDGGGLGQVSMVETTHLYDLAPNLDAIAIQLEKTELDLATATASRVQLVDTDRNRSDQVILFADGDGSRYVCYLADPSFPVEKLAA